MKRIQKPPASSIRIIMIAVLMIVVVKVLVIDGLDSYKPASSLKVEDVIAVEERDEGSSQSLKGPMSYNPKESSYSEPDEYFGKYIESYAVASINPHKEMLKREEQPKRIKSKIAPVSLNSYPAEMYKGQPKVVVIIDDMGMSYKYTDAAIDLPAPLTLAFLPYAARLEETTKLALGRGHELIIHVPMEPMNEKIDLGPVGLKTDMGYEELNEVLAEDVFNSFEGYVGINNHMGSKLTQNRKMMGWVMQNLFERGLLFVDSKTISTSVATEIAGNYGVPYAQRDVFLDHYEDLCSVRQSLINLEKISRRKGVAIAIGHPKKNTILALKEWLPTLEAKGIKLVPVSVVANEGRAKFVERYAN